MNQTKADLLEGEAVNHWHSLTGLRSIFNQTISALREAQAEIERLRQELDGVIKMIGEIPADPAVESRLGEQAVPVGDASAVTFDELKDRVWNLCHTLLNGDVEAAEDLAEQLMEDLYP